jgi:hypothetical protein
MVRFRRIACVKMACRARIPDRYRQSNPALTLDILRMDVTKELLRKMEKEERALFLALGHASNQVNALWKLVIILTNGGG